MSNANEIAEMGSAQEITQAVEERVMEMTDAGELRLPANYSAANALKAALLELQQTQDKKKRPVLESCTNSSIYNSLFKMVQLGLNVAKEQGYFIAYGEQLQFQKSYFGSIAIAKRMANVEEVYPHAIYEDDVFETEIVAGIERVTKHEQTFQSRAKGDMIGAYAVIKFTDSKPDYYKIMTMGEIKERWKVSPNYKPNDPSCMHNKYPRPMAFRTIINAATKPFINSSSDDHLFIEAYHDEADHAEKMDQEKEKAMARGEVIDISTAVQKNKKDKMAPSESAENTDNEPAAENTSDYIEPADKAADEPARSSERENSREPEPESVKPPWEESC